MHELELKYQLSLRDADAVIHEEALRRLRLRIMLLENDNRELQEHLADEQDQADYAEKETQRMEVRIQDLEDETRRCEADLRAKTREISTMKVCCVGLSLVTC